MAITLTYGSAVITLPDALVWADEHTWSPVELVAERSVTGAMLLDFGTKLSGRLITLQPEDLESAWVPLATLESLKVWAAVPGRQMVLNLRGATYSVVFRHYDGAIEADAIVHYDDAVPTDWYSVTIRLLEI